jgi:hypothetical protein
LFVYEPPKKQDAPGKTCLINTSIVLRNFIKTAPGPGIFIEVTSSINFGEEDEHKVTVVETLDLMTMMGGIIKRAGKETKLLSFTSKCTLAFALLSPMRRVQTGMIGTRILN